MSTYAPDSQEPSQKIKDLLQALVDAADEEGLKLNLSTGAPDINRYIMQKDDIDRWFTYHPVLSEHQRVNDAAKQLAKCVMYYMPDTQKQMQFFTEIQFIRMMLNQTLTMMELDGIDIPDFS